MTYSLALLLVKLSLEYDTSILTRSYIISAASFECGLLEVVHVMLWEKNFQNSAMCLLQLQKEQYKQNAKILLCAICIFMSRSL